ncbi:MAG: thiamine pyrophosphate-binding protein [Candidatus Heimdallarchaeota archaeon]
MIDSEAFISFLEKKFHFITGIPCSYFKDLLEHLSAKNTNNKLQHIIATREDEAMGIASGIAFSGKLALVYMQNSGFANVGDALTSLAQLYKLPMLLLISYRGLEPDIDFPEHSLMGEVTEPLLTAYNIPYFDLTEDNWETIMKQALLEMEQISAPVALLIKSGVLNQ